LHIKYSIIIPVYNEVEKIDLLVNDLKIFKEGFEIFIIDDGSNDGTSEKKFESPNVRLIKNSVNMGKSSSVLNALYKVQGEYIILFDGDLEIMTSEINKLIIQHSKDESYVVKGRRKLLSKELSIFGIGGFVLNKLFNTMYKTSFKDIFCCLIIIKKNMLETFSIESKKFGIETEIMANVARRKIKVIEVDITYNRRERTKGKKLKIFDTFEILKVMFSNKKL
jgi:glycosyltransferase involved in cell wall biosynthesis